MTIAHPVAHVVAHLSRILSSCRAPLCVSPPIPPVQHNRVLRSTTSAAHPVCFTAMPFKIGLRAAAPLSVFSGRASITAIVGCGRKAQAG
jgi:hypothetical protein